MKIVVYTASFGARDRLSLKPVDNSEITYRCFTDIHQDPVQGWEIVHVSRHAGSPRRAARRLKCMSHEIDCDVSVWIDGNMHPLLSKDDILDIVSRGDFTCHSHPARNSLYEEAATCKELGVGNKTELNSQIEKYRTLGMPDDTWLAETGVVVRNHTPNVIALNEMWWDEILNGSDRDQISLPFCAWKLGFSVTRIPEDVRKSALISWSSHIPITRPTRSLEIGPGSNPLGGFESMDISSDATYSAEWGVQDIPTPDMYFNEVYASHVLEHVPWHQTIAALKEARRVMYPGSPIEIWVPNFAYICEKYLSGECGDDWRRHNPTGDPVLWAAGRIFTYGPAGKWHRAMFDADHLSKCFIQAGFYQPQLIPKRTRGTSHGPIDLGMRAVA